MNVALSPMTFWYHDLCSCLHNTIATVLHYHHQEPTQTLGAVWDFYYAPAQFHKEEYFFPSRRSTLAENLTPYHPIRADWQDSSAADSWPAVRAAVARGTPAIVAVDNFYLPFRPAYQDLHAGHLLIVYGFDDATDQVYVLDSSPPEFMGAMRREELQAARGAANPADQRDSFFSGTPVSYRWFTLDIDTAAMPALTREWVTTVISANLRRFRSPEDATPAAMAGMAGLERYLAALCEQSTTSAGSTALEQLYGVGWAVQASTALHADFLTLAGRTLEWPRLVEIGRLVDRIAHHWTALRMLGAHYRERPTEITMRLEQRAARILADQYDALAQLDWEVKAVDVRL